jgi:hypothetical protein
VSLNCSKHSIKGNILPPSQRSSRKLHNVEIRYYIDNILYVKLHQNISWKPLPLPFTIFSTQNISVLYFCCYNLFSFQFTERDCFVWCVLEDAVVLKNLLNDESLFCNVCSC